MRQRLDDPPEFSLHEWASLRAELIWIYDRPPLPQSRRMRCDRKELFAWFVREGQATVTTATKTLIAHPGEWIMLPTGKATHQFSGNAWILSLRFLCQWPSAENLFANPEGVIIPGSECPELERKGKQLERMVQRQFPDAGKQYALQFSSYDLFLRFQSLFLHWLSLWVQLRVAHGGRLTRLCTGDDRILRAARCLNNAALKTGFPRERLKDETSLSEVHLNRLFLQAFGLTPAKCWEKRRLESAKRYLETSAAPIKEIAYHIGFRSPSHFVSWFQRKEGRTPRQHRSETALQ